MNYFIETIGRIIPEEEAALEALEQVMKLRVYRKNEIIQQAGAVCKKVICVNKGALYMYKNKDGKEEVVEFYIEGMLCSDYVSFIRQALRTTRLRRWKIVN